MPSCSTSRWICSVPTIALAAFSIQPRRSTATLSLRIWCLTAVDIYGAIHVSCERCPASKASQQTKVGCPPTFRRSGQRVDTADFYGPHVTNRLIREALRPYPEDLVIVTKVGAKRSALGSVHPAMSRDDLTRAVHDNLKNLGLDALDVVVLRSMIRESTPAEGSLEEPLSVLIDLRRQGLLRHIGLSNVTPTQVAQGRRLCDLVCVQNLYNLTYREDDDLIDELAREDIPYVAYFPLGGFAPMQSSALSRIANRLAATPAQVALAWLLQRSPNLLPIPGTSSAEHLRESLAAATLELPADAVAELNSLERAEQSGGRT
jgi:pyridoxine 4-dehydrogenase